SADSFDTPFNMTFTSSGTASLVTVTASLAASDMDGIGPGDLCVIKFWRQVDHGSDTATGDFGPHGFGWEED
ncbi:hypothetical protein LCGC14_2199590, partial [marine sediment metagenome]